jgi:hypothetical protein
MRICSSSLGRGALIGTITAVALTTGASAAATLASAPTTLASAPAGTPATAASPAAISVSKPCYVNAPTANRAAMTVTGSGFVPAAAVQFSSSDGTVTGQTTASSAGTITYTTPAPDPPFTLPGQQTVTLTATQGTTTATTPVTVAPLAVGISPSQATASKKVTWYFSGFEPGGPVFGHYLRRKQVALVRFGRAAGACGVLRARALLYPGGHPRYHLYGLQLDDSARYSSHSSPRLVKKIQFRLVSAPPAHPKR